MALARSAEELSAPRRWIIFTAIMLPYVFYAFCWNTENFLRPYIAEALGLSKTEVASFYTLQALGALIGAITLSQIADRYSRRNTFAVVSFGFGLAALGIIFVDSFIAALVQRFVMGFFMGGVFGCAVSLYVGLFPPHFRGLLAGIVQLVYNGGDALLAWFGRHYDESNWQVVLQIGGVGAVCAAICLVLVVPSDRTLTPWGINAAHSRPIGASVFVARDLFIEGRWRLTIRLALMCGLNFFAFQAFSGWATTYLRDLQGYSPDLVGRLMTVMHVGSMTGALVWGVLADRMGRRASAAGFMVSAVFIVLYLNLPPSTLVYGLTGFVYGFGYVCSGVWGPYFAELYPEYLRATAASIFNWGRVVSLFGALVAGAIAETFGLQTIMYVGAATFALAGLLWWSLPETLPSRLASMRG